MRVEAVVDRDVKRRADERASSHETQTGSRKCTGPTLQRKEMEGLDWGFDYLLNKLGTSSQMCARLLAVCT